jgi:hypothetical protein
MMDLIEVIERRGCEVVTRRVERGTVFLMVGEFFHQINQVKSGRKVLDETTGYSVLSSRKKERKQAD